MLFVKSFFFSHGEYSTKLGLGYVQVIAISEQDKNWYNITVSVNFYFPILDYYLPVFDEHGKSDLMQWPFFKPPVIWRWLKSNSPLPLEMGYTKDGWLLTLDTRILERAVIGADTNTESWSCQRLKFLFPIRQWPNYHGPTCKVNIWVQSPKSEEEMVTVPLKSEFVK